MLPQYSIAIAVLVFIIVGLLMLGGVIFLSWAIRPLKARPKAEETYECGFPAKGDARAVGFSYLNYAGLFLVFDLAALYLFLYALIDAPPIVTLSFFLGLVTLGLIIVYGTRKRRYYVA